MHLDGLYVVDDDVVETRVRGRSAAITLVTLFMCSSETIWSKLEGTKCQLGRKWRSQWPSTPSCMSTFEERP